MPNSDRLNALNEGEPPGGLTFWEATKWRPLYHILEERGYRLRGRYKPGWCDQFHHVLDATRISDGQQVILKMLSPSSPELSANILLLSEPARSDSRNHCLLVLDVFCIGTKEVEIDFVVFPLYRSWFDPPHVHLVAEIIPFMNQLLEGLCFLHDLNIAHGDIKALNVLMDPSPMYPHGFNPLVTGRPDRRYSLAHDPAPVRTRLTTKIHYVYNDFGACTVFESIEARKLVQYKRRGTFDAPECTIGELYDPFAYDVWLLGKLFLDLGLYDMIPAMETLIFAMYASEPTSRLKAQQCLDILRTAVPKMAWGLLARIPNPIVTIYHTPDSWSRYFMGPTRNEDAREYLRRMVELLVMNDGVPCIQS
ncbi:hypothetical protein PENSPDRAFT_736490 [Peniophora sp. CONT]|nr:hypothetical protein PENSPDRAFT_736490 [Peniophora sp. CONT]